MSPKVCIINESSLQASHFSKSIGLLNLREKVQNAKKIFIKPNLCAGTIYKPDTGVVIGAALIEKIILYLRSENENCKIFIGDSDSTGHGYAFKKFKFLDYGRLEKENISLIDLTRTESRLIEVEGLYFKKVDYPEILLDIDFFVSVSKIKTHSISRISGILKNQFGCLPYMDKKFFHPYIEKVIYDANLVRKPDLGILDGNPAMEGFGPVHGDPIPLELILIGDDPVALDSLMCDLMGFDPKKVKHLVYGYNKGLGEMDLNRIKLFFIDKEIELSDLRRRFLYIPAQQRFFIISGLFIQRIGNFISNLGHLLHGAKSVRDFSKVLKILSKGIQKFLKK